MAIQQGVKDGRDIKIRHVLQQHSIFSQWLILSISLIAIGSIIGLNIFLEYGRTQSREEERLLTSTKILQENIGQNLIATRDVLVGLRQRLPKGRADKDLITRLQALTDAIPGVRTLAIIDASGTIRASNRMELIGKNFRQRDYFKVPQQQPDKDILYLTPPFKSIFGVFTLSASVIIPGTKGEFAGVVTAQLDPIYFAPIMESVLYAPDMWVTTTHWDGSLFMIKPEMKGLAGEKIKLGYFFYQHVESGKDFSVHRGINNITGDDRLLVGRTVHPTGLNIPTPLVVIASRSHSAIFTKWRNDSLKFAAAYGIIVLVSIMVLYTFQRRQKQFSAERKKAEKELQESEEKYRVLFEKSSQGILIGDLETGRFTFANSSICRMFGYSEPELRQLRMEDIHPKDAMDNVKAGFVLQMRGVKSLAASLPCLRKDGTVFHADVNASSSIIINERKCIVGFFTDVTERIKEEEVLQRSEKKYRDLYQGSRDGYVVVNMAGDILEYNNTYREMLGYTDEELITKTYTDLTPVKWHALEAVIVETRIIPNGFSDVYEKEYIRKDKTVFPVELRTYLVRDESGQPQYMWAFIRDITDRKKAEEKLVLFAGELERSNKELDDFAYIASHDLKEPLRGIHNYSSFLLEDYADKLDTDGKDKLKTLIYLTKRLEAFINDLLKFSRISRAPLTTAETAIDEVIQDTLALIKPLLEKEHIDVRIPRRLPAVKCDYRQMVEVWQNLIANAVKYNDKPDKWIEIGYNKDGNTEDNYVFYMRDNGIGIDKKYFDSIFTIFKRLHARDKFGGGTGAGLTIVKKIIERHGGKIWLESRPAEGTTFYFTLQGEKNDH